MSPTQSWPETARMKAHRGSGSGQTCRELPSLIEQPGVLMKSGQERPGDGRPLTGSGLILPSSSVSQERSQPPYFTSSHSRAPGSPRGSHWTSGPQLTVLSDGKKTAEDWPLEDLCPCQGVAPPLQVPLASAKAHGTADVEATGQVRSETPWAERGNKKAPAQRWVVCGGAYVTW